ncbi:nucleotide modification associated domain-containing protein [Lactobacillus amylovorus]|uniref:nucleotide modification associated domain-containing protein n=1 Tax=Lactobacillus amylovorus TaxID=1604 RepID=UPI003CFE66DF
MVNESNPFKDYTNHLAETLQEKNDDYGDSFTKSVYTYGLPVIGVRLSDKYNRIEHLITHHELKENDESLEDTLLDMAGYAILGLKYLEEHKDESN